MIRGASVRWRLVAWVTGVLAAVCAVTFAVVYDQTGRQLSSQVDGDVHSDLTQLVATAQSAPDSPARLERRLRSYVHAQPYHVTTPLLFAVVSGGAISNHPELFGGRRDRGETRAEQAKENAEGRALLTAAPGLRTTSVADIGRVRVDVRVLNIAGRPVRLGVAESLADVERAQHTVARAFLIAGALALVFVLAASYLVGVWFSRPLRRLARVAQRVDEGELEHRMRAAPTTSREVRVLADSFDHMLDRLQAAFGHERAFMADAAHELRTPLTVIAGQLEVLAAQRSPTGEDIGRVQRVVSAEVARTSRLVDDMLLLARSERGDFLRREELELPSFVADLWHASTIGRRRCFVLGDVPPGQLDADGDRVAQALRNLIDNAIAHTEEDEGEVRLDVEAVGGRRVRFAVSDNGPGIPKSERTRIFERFYRSDDARDRVSGGTGLGLAIVQAIVAAHGGTVRALDAPGGGARVEIVLPGLRPAPATGERVVAPHVRL